MVTHLEMADIAANCRDHAGQFGTRRERQLGLELVFVLDDQHIREVHAGRFHVDNDVIFPTYRIGDFLVHERIGQAVRLAHQCFHSASPVCFLIAAGDCMGWRRFDSRRADQIVPTTIRPPPISVASAGTSPKIMKPIEKFYRLCSRDIGNLVGAGQAPVSE